MAGDLDHTPIGRQVALEHDQTPCSLYRVGRWINHLLAGGFPGGGRFLPNRPAGHGDGVLVQEPQLFEPMRHKTDATRFIKVGRNKASARLQVGKQRNPLVDPVEIIEIERHVSLSRDGQQVQHRVG